jgi:hypothetical protein
MKLEKRRKFIFVLVLGVVLLIFLVFGITLLPGIKGLLGGAH